MRLSDALRSEAPVVYLDRDEALQFLRLANVEHVDPRTVQRVRGERRPNGGRDWYVEPPTAVIGGPDIVSGAKWGHQA
jgi:hypothetical protein